MAAKKTASKPAAKKTAPKSKPGRKSLITNVAALKGIDKDEATTGQIVAAFQKATGLSESDARDHLIRQGFGRYRTLAIFAA